MKKLYISFLLIAFALVSKAAVITITAFNGTLSPATVQRVSIGDLIVVSNLSTPTNKSITITKKLPDNSQTNVSMAYGKKDTTTVTENGVYSITLNVTTVHIATYAKSTFHLIYDTFPTNAFDFTTPTAHLFDEVYITLRDPGTGQTVTTITSFNLKKPDNTTVLVNSGIASTFILDQIGTYTLDKGNGVLKTIIVDNSGVVTSFEDNVLSTESLFYPNPVNDVITVEGNATVLSITGEVLVEGNGKINVSQLSSGVYLLKTDLKSIRFVKE